MLLILLCLGERIVICHGSLVHVVIIVGCSFLSAGALKRFLCWCMLHLAGKVMRFCNVGALLVVFLAFYGSALFWPVLIVSVGKTWSTVISSLHAFWDMKKPVTWGVTYTIWLLIGSSRMSFKNTAPSILINVLLALTSLLVVATMFCLWYSHLCGHAPANKTH